MAPPLMSPPTMFRLRCSRSAGPIALPGANQGAEARREALDLRLDAVGHVLRRAERDVAVGPGRVQSGRGSRVVEEGRLRQQDVRAFRVAAFARRALGLGDLLERAAEVQASPRACSRRRPRNRAVESPVELEDPRAVPVPAKRTGVVRRKAIAGDPEQLSRDDVGEDDIGARQLVDRARGVNLAAELLEPIDQRIREALRARPREAPSVDMRPWRSGTGRRPRSASSPAGAWSAPRGRRGALGRAPTGSASPGPCALESPARAKEKSTACKRRFGRGRNGPRTTGS